MRPDKGYNYSSVGLLPLTAAISSSSAAIFKFPLAAALGSSPGSENTDAEECNVYIQISSGHVEEDDIFKAHRLKTASFASVSKKKREKLATASGSISNREKNLQTCGNSSTII